MKNDKIVWLEQLGAVAETLTALPDDVRICRLYQDENDRLRFQILEHPGVTADKVTGRTTYDWGESSAYPLAVGWCKEFEEGEDDDDL